MRSMISALYTSAKAVSCAVVSPAATVRSSVSAVTRSKDCAVLGGYATAVPLRPATLSKVIDPSTLMGWLASSPAIAPTVRTFSPCDVPRAGATSTTRWSSVVGSYEDTSDVPIPGVAPTTARLKRKSAAAAFSSVCAVVICASASEQTATVRTGNCAAVVSASAASIVWSVNS
jgi:hypothetical protein